ncbi:histidine triad nucleotide-binding protein [Motiliproteus sediminis]|uniref:histidine triad nucleotide-binding protein n=1 Tax=Motiliproteus sediminis TaxID=1468178 RepID=UPI001AEFD7D0|nr:histidine triad nucleotide-binding protein [Motiliproteus sediminis]
MSCLFCKIVDKEIPADIVYEDDAVLAFRDINPQAPNHLLVIPKQHIATLNDLSDADAATVGLLSVTAAKLARELGFADSGYRTVMNCNEHGGQTVYHIHLHLLGGKAMGWPPYSSTLKTAIG